MQGFRMRIIEAGIVDAARIVLPAMDARFQLAKTGAEALSAGKERIAAEAVSKPDWRNDLTQLLIDINQAFAGGESNAEKKAKLKAIRRAIENARAEAPARCRRRQMPWPGDALEATRCELLSLP